MWFPSLAYGLGTTNLSYKQLDTIQQPIVHHILPAMGYNRHFPRAVVYGSPRFGGLNFKHLYTEQGTQHVMQFLKYYRCNNSIGQLLRIAGLSFCPLRRPQIDYHHIQDKDGSKPSSSSSTNVMVVIETSDPINTLCRHGNSCIMEDFLLLAPTKMELILLNQCRLYLRVTTLSDITSTNGTNLRQNIWEGTTPQPSPTLWPRQNRPSANAWQIWRRFLYTNSVLYLRCLYCSTNFLE